MAAAGTIIFFSFITAPLRTLLMGLQGPHQIGRNPWENLARWVEKGRTRAML